MNAPLRGAKMVPVAELTASVRPAARSAFCSWYSCGLADRAEETSG